MRCELGGGFLDLWRPTESWQGEAPAEPILPEESRLRRSVGATQRGAHLSFADARNGAK